MSYYRTRPESPDVLVRPRVQTDSHGTVADRVISGKKWRAEGGGAGLPSGHVHVCLCVGGL